MPTQAQKMEHEVMKIDAMLNNTLIGQPNSIYLNSNFLLISALVFMVRRLMIMKEEVFIVIQCS